MMMIRTYPGMLFFPLFLFKSVLNILILFNHYYSIEYNVLRFRILDALLLVYGLSNYIVKFQPS